MTGQFQPGQIFRTSLVVDAELVERFIALSGDRNPVHTDLQQARLLGYPRPIAHGTILIAALSRVIGMEFPGPGSIWIRQAIEWVQPVLVGDEISLVLEVQAYSHAAGVLEIGVVATNQGGEQVLRGNGSIKVPDEMISQAKEETRPIRRVALVTGGGRGIGAAISRQLASAGWTIIVGYLRNAEIANTLIKEIHKNGGKAFAFSADMMDAKEVRDLVNRVVRTCGRLDAIVHAATPKIDRAAIGEFSYPDCEPYVRAYAGALLGLITAAKPHMEEQHFGRIISLGTAALFGSPPTGFGSYLIGKGAALELVRSAATELGPLGITVNMVSPGLTVTELTSDMSARSKELEARRSPMRRLATTEDTAALVEFLLSDAAGYINGAHMPVTGGPQ